MCRALSALSAACFSAIALLHTGTAAASSAPLDVAYTKIVADVACYDTSGVILVDVVASEAPQGALGVGDLFAEALEQLAEQTTDTEKRATAEKLLWELEIALDTALAAAPESFAVDKMNTDQPGSPVVLTLQDFDFGIDQQAAGSLMSDVGDYTVGFEIDLATLLGGMLLYVDPLSLQPKLSGNIGDKKGQIDLQLQGSVDTPSVGVTCDVATFVTFVTS